MVYDFLRSISTFHYFVELSPPVHISVFDSNSFGVSKLSVKINNLYFSLMITIVNITPIDNKNINNYNYYHYNNINNILYVGINVFHYGGKYGIIL